MSRQKRAGIIYVKVDGVLQEAKGSWTYNLGANKREAITGAHRVLGYKEEVQTAFIEGEIIDAHDLDLERLVNLDGVTVTLELANGKTIVLRDGWFAGEGDVDTDEANIKVRFEGDRAEEIKANV